MNTPKLATLALFTTAVLLSGCAAPATTATAEKEKPKAVKAETSQDDAPAYSSLGSWIPRKVKKKEDVIGTNTVTASGEALEKVNASASTRTVQEGQLSGPR